MSAFIKILGILILCTNSKIHKGEDSIYSNWLIKSTIIGHHWSNIYIFYRKHE